MYKYDTCFVSCYRWTRAASARCQYTCPLAGSRPDASQQHASHASQQHAPHASQQHASHASQQDASQQHASHASQQDALQQHASHASQQRASHARQGKHYLGRQADASNRTPSGGVAVEYHFHGKQYCTEAHCTGAVILAGKRRRKCDTGSGQQDLQARVSGIESPGVWVTRPDLPGQCSQATQRQDRALKLGGLQQLLSGHSPDGHAVRKVSFACVHS